MGTWGIVALVSALIVSLVATFAAPTWVPRPWTEPAPITTTDTSIAPALPATAAVGTYGVDRRQIEVELPDGTVVDASVRMPLGAPGPVPGMVVMHGTGTAGSDAFYDLTNALASAGIASIVPAKRADGYSTWHRDYEQLAADYRRSWEALAATPGVDPARVGVYGESEGALIAPILAAEHPETDFVVLVSSPVMPLRWQGLGPAANYLHNTHVPATVVPVLPRILGGPFPGGILDYMDTDTRGALERLGQPVLTVYGTGDASMPLIQGAAEIEARLRDAGGHGVRPTVDATTNAPRDGAAVTREQAAEEQDAEGAERAWGHTVRYYDGASHGLRIDGQLVEAWPRDLARWVDGLPGTADAAPHVAGAAPAQRYEVAQPPAPYAFASGEAIPLGFLPPLVLLAGGMLIAPIARFRERPGGGVQADRVRGRRLVRRVAWSAVALVAAQGVVYLQWVIHTVELAVTYRLDDFGVQGGLLLVYVLGALAVGLVVTGIALELRAGRAARTVRQEVGDGPEGGARTGRLEHRLTVVGLLGGAALLVLALAYWGALPLWR